MGLKAKRRSKKRTQNAKLAQGEDPQQKEKREFQGEDTVHRLQAATQSEAPLGADYRKQGNEVDGDLSVANLLYWRPKA